LQLRLREAGFQHYEVSAYAKPARQSRHNRNYWEFGDYLGIGAGAHSKLSFPHRIIRQARFKQPASYLQNALTGSVIQEEHEVERASLGFEFMLNALRLTEGVPTRLFIERTGQSTQSIEAALQRAERKGLLEADHQNIRPTPLGQRFLNDLQQIFLPD
jgi:oxygen-independent coproporphyrinogen-3 oxidase